MRVADLRCGDLVIVRLDRRERRARVRNFTCTVGPPPSYRPRYLVCVDLATGQRNIRVHPRLVLRRAGRGAFARRGAPVGTDAQIRENEP